MPNFIKSFLIIHYHFLFHIRLSPPTLNHLSNKITSPPFALLFPNLYLFCKEATGHKYHRKLTTQTSQIIHLNFVHPYFVFLNFVFLNFVFLNFIFLNFIFLNFISLYFVFLFHASILHISFHPHVIKAINP